MKIDILNITINDFQTIGHCSIDLDKQGVLLIKGENYDKGGSNGAGKSTFPNALLWCYFGKILCGEIGDNVIRRGAIGATYVKSLFRVEKITYSITRYRKHKKYKNFVKLEVINDGTCTDISCCTASDTNDKIVTLIGATFEQFVNANVFCSEIRPFLDKSDKAQKETLLSPNVIEKFSNAQKKSAELIRELKENNIKFEGDEKLTQTQIDFAQINIDKFIVLQKESENSKIALNNDISDCEKRLTASNIGKNNLQETLLKVTKEQENLITEFNKLSDSVIEYQKIYIKVDLNKHSLLNNKKDLKRKLDTISHWETKEKINVNKETDLETELENTTLAIQSKKARIQELQKEHDSSNEEFSETSLQIQTLKNFMDEQSISIKTIEEHMNATLINLHSHRSSLAQLVTTKGDLDKYNSEKCKTCEHSRVKELQQQYALDISGIQKKIDKLAKDVEDFKIYIDKLHTEKESNTDLLIKSENYKFGLESKREKLLAAIYDTEQEIVLQEHSYKSCQKELNNLPDYEDTIQIYKSEQHDLIEKVKTIELDIKQDEDKLNLFKLPDLDNASKVIDEKGIEIVSLQSNLNMCQNKIVTINNDVTHYSATITELKDYSDDIIKCRKEMCDLDKNKEDIKKSIAINLKRIKRLYFWKSGFSQTGIESFMLDSIINKLNNSIADYIYYLSNGTMGITIDTAKSNKKGKVTNKNAITVSNPYGSNSYRSSSSGERKIMDVSALFALKDVAHSTTGNTWNILILDEVFTNLDAQACSLVTSLIKHINSAESIFVISHLSSVYLDFNANITMIKKDGVTSLLKEEINV